MDKTDYLNKRTTNINIRVSPSLKSALMLEGAKLGVCLSDYVNHALTLALENPTMECADCTNNQELITQLQNELDEFKELAEPFLSALDEGLVINNKKLKPKSKYELIKFLLLNLKTKKNEG